MLTATRRTKGESNMPMRIMRHKLLENSYSENTVIRAKILS